LYEKWTNGREIKTTYRGVSSQSIVEVNPEEAMQSYSTLFTWEPWLSKCFRHFYESGKFRIPNECQGHDLLVALEYLRILTLSPNLFVYETPFPYERIKTWSNYFTQRKPLLDWVVQDIQNSGRIRTYITSNSLEDVHSKITVKNGQPTTILGHKNNRLADFASKIFQSKPSSQSNIPQLLRHDFRNQLVRILPEGTMASFELHRVTIQNQSRKEIRPVLRMEGFQQAQTRRAKPLLVVDAEVQSVTSGLSYSILDEGSLATFFKQHATLSEQEEKFEPTNLKKQPGIQDISKLRLKSSNDNNKEQRATNHNRSKEFSSRRTPHSRRRQDKEQRSSSRRRGQRQEDDSDADTNTKRSNASYTASESFESFLFTVCDKGVAFCDQLVTNGPFPSGSRDISPVKLITCAEDQTQFSLLSFEPQEYPGQQKDSFPNECNHDELIRTLSQELFPATVAQVKSVGDSLYQQYSANESNNITKSRTLPTNNLGKNGNSSFQRIDVND
jgi:hypothetical protein